MSQMPGDCPRGMGGFGIDWYINAAIFGSSFAQFTLYGVFGRYFLFLVKLASVCNEFSKYGRIHKLSYCIHLDRHMRKTPLESPV